MSLHKVHIAILCQSRKRCDDRTLCVLGPGTVRPAAASPLRLHPAHARPTYVSRAPAALGSAAFEPTDETLARPGGSLEKRGKPSPRAGGTSDGVSPERPARRCLMRKKGPFRQLALDGKQISGRFPSTCQSHVGLSAKYISMCAGNTRESGRADFLNAFHASRTRGRRR